MLVETFEWYDPLISCLKCGDQWSGGERLARPFARGWRERAVAQLERHITTLALDGATAPMTSGDSSAD